MREREKRTKDLLVREREIEEERSRWLGSASLASLLGWAGLGWALLFDADVVVYVCVCVCMCVNVRGRVRDREKMREFCE